MNHYKQSLALQASPSRVYKALTEEVQHWWTQDCELASEVGGIVRLRFGNTWKEMRIQQLVPSREVRWLCTGAHIAVAELAHKDEWVGTELIFRISPQGDGQSLLEFEQPGLVPEFECYELCTGAWQYFLASLQQYLATGKGTPYEPAAATN